MGVETDSHAFKILKHRSFVAAKPTPLKNFNFMGQAAPKFNHQSSNYIFHNFNTPDEMTAAFVATGEATMYGLFSGVQMLQPSKKDAFSDVYQNKTDGYDYTLPLLYWDGGHPITFSGLDQASPPKTPRNKRALLYYHMLFSTDDIWAGSGVAPKVSSVVYKKGVKRTLDCLCRSDFTSFSMNEKKTDWKGDRMTII